MSDWGASYHRLTDWLGLYRERIALAIILYVMWLTGTVGAAYRLALRSGWHEPTDRTMHALFSGAGSLFDIVNVVLIAVIAGAIYRRWRGRIEPPSLTEYGSNSSMGETDEQ